DLVYGTASGPLQYYVNSGTPEIPSWQENISLFGGVLDAGGASNPFFYDYDGDGDLDMFSGSWLGDVLYFENTGTSTGPAWQENSEPFESLKHSIYSAVTVGDVNADGHPDAIVGDLSGGLFYHRNTGDGFVYEAELLQDINLGGWACPRLVDFDTDGDLDIIAGNEDGDLAYIENQGSPSLPEWVEIPGFFNGVGVNHSCAPAICDVDLDGDFDILCGNLSGELYYFEQDDGMWLPNPEMFQGISVDQNATPAFADLDNDGDPDLTIGEYNGPFNYYSNQLMVAGIDPSTNAQPDASVFPNPLTDESRIEFSLKNKGDVSVQVFDARGQHVYSVFRKNLTPGKHSVALNAESLPSGLYLFRLNLAGETMYLKGVRR
ncbi:MAG: FG-GAP-like repeat-containing protein, partial [Bacteroidales bacterium]